MNHYMRNLALALAFTFIATFALSQQVLFNNGSFVTHPGGGPGGTDFSFLMSPLVNFGFGNQVSSGNRASDDFTVTGSGWVIDSVIFFQYQTGSSTASTITSINLMVWDQSQVVWGDATTNRLVRSVFSGCYRGDDFQNTQRPVMRNTVRTSSLILSPGVYSLDWQASGSLASGPWCVPITITGQMTTGDALGYSDGAWGYLYGDTLNLFRQGLPFIIYGRPAGYPSQITISRSYTFSDPYSISSYRIVGLPGVTNFPVSSIMSGNPGENWIAFWDNGQASDYMKTYDNSNVFTFRPGNAFWVSSESSVSVSKTVPSVPLNPYDTYGIPIHAGGWTLISNPFEMDVAWNDVRIFNGLEDTYMLWEWVGYWKVAGTMRPGDGYYFLGPDWMSELEIPYPGGLLKKEPAACLSSGNCLTLSLLDGESVTSSVQVSFDKNSQAGIDIKDIFKPTGHFESMGLRLLLNDADGRTNGLFRDSREGVGCGQSYELEIRNQSGRPLFLSCDGTGIPGDNELWLVSKKTNQRTDLRRNGRMVLAPGIEVKTLLIGNPGFIESKSGEIFSGIPDLFNAFPNPFRKETTIGFVVESQGYVKLELFDIRGVKVRQILDRYLEAGYHEVSLSSVATGTGTFFCRLTQVPASGFPSPARTIKVQSLP